MPWIVRTALRRGTRVRQGVRTGETRAQPPRPCNDGDKYPEGGRRRGHAEAVAHVSLLACLAGLSSGCRCCSSSRTRFSSATRRWTRADTWYVTGSCTTPGRDEPVVGVPVGSTGKGERHVLEPASFSFFSGFGLRSRVFATNGGETTLRFGNSCSVSCSTLRKTSSRSRLPKLDEIIRLPSRRRKKTCPSGCTSTGPASRSSTPSGPTSCTNCRSSSLSSRMSGRPSSVTSATETLSLVYGIGVSLPLARAMTETFISKYLRFERMCSPRTCDISESILSTMEP
mmetsp:Transcript_48657/g.161164  ORF Transcript_48657/g.161164 Transcript_48657/m.161164 type:complete len:285 (+) Transcript_48657:69-923(+)